MAEVSNVKKQGVLSSVQPGHMFQFVDRRIEGGRDKRTFLMLETLGNRIKLGTGQLAGVALDSGTVIAEDADAPVRLVTEVSLKTPL